MQFNVDSSANSESCRTETFDLSKERDAKRFGYSEEEWVALTDVEKQAACTEWAYNHIDIFYEENPE